MSDKVLLIDIDKCVGCYTCEVACKQEHDLPIGPRWCRAFTIGPREAQGELQMDMVPSACLHCDDPTCAYFCSPGAITRREDGVILINADKCNGCQLCVYGCPYGAIYFDKDKRVAGKCDLCVSRIDDGLEPSCVQHCISGSLQFVTGHELKQITSGMHTASNGKVCYASSKWKLSIPGFNRVTRS